ncbi:hypothetical protein KJ878_01920 [Patescibacteria group bacterium]|nr:hypothetical protein [Patescibacteria group bacterium]
MIIAKRPGSNIAIKQYSNIILISLHYFLSFSICWIVYKIGYGFDQFIHQATMDLIDKAGEVHPKPFYYLGQYSLIIILHKITFISIEWLNKLLVPALAAVYLPAAIYHALTKWFEDKKTNLLLIITLLIFPFSFFILTTPQNLAYLLLILIIFLGLTCSNVFELLIIYLLAITALAIQPIAGIPAILFAALLTVFHGDKVKIKKYLYLLIFLLSIITLPIAFLIFENGYNISNSLKMAMEASGSMLPLLKFNLPEQENFILNFIYLYWFNLKIIIGLISAAGIIIACRSLKLCKLFMIYLIMSISLLASYLITKKLSFGFLIEYERGDYPDRILIIAIFFLAPFLLTSLYWLISRILNQNKIIKLIFLIFAAILISTSLYLSYPRFDHYFNSRCFSTSKNDIEAVNWIENNTESDYIVLANQQVSAAALREFGFKKYYSPPLIDKERGSGGEVFYYPVPTGGPLYQYYLDMVYEKPSRETMAKAMDLAGVSEGYFVLNKYWRAFDKILEEAKLEADSWEDIGDGDVFVFKYYKTQNNKKR